MRLDELSALSDWFTLGKSFNRESQLMGTCCRTTSVSVPDVTCLDSVIPSQMFRENFDPFKNWGH